MNSLTRLKIRLITTTIISSVALLLTPHASYSQSTSPVRRMQLSSELQMMVTEDPVNNNIQLGNGIGQFDNHTCTLTGNPAANVNLRCGNTFPPLAETAIAVDPNNPSHLLVGAILRVPILVGQTFIHDLIGYFVSFDGGTTWVSGQIPATAGGAADPSPAFNAKFGTAHMAHIAPDCSSGVCTFSVEVSSSEDGGLSWKNAVWVSKGLGHTSVSQTAIVNDKPWLVADNNPSSPYYGRLYLTWSRFSFFSSGDFESPIYISYSDDGGKKWSESTEISGSNITYCTSTIHGLLTNRCLDNQFSTPVVLPNGVVVVHFLNGDNYAAFEAPFESDSQTIAVRSTDGGVTWSPPIHIADLEDGPANPPSFSLPHLGDYPINIIGSNTQTGHQFLVWSVQGMTADPVTGYLYAFWCDNRDGIHDSDTPVTQTNVFMTKSTDGGVTWVGPTRVTSGSGDRWMAWGGAYNNVVRVMFMDGSYDYPNRTLSGVTLGSSSDGGSTWSFERVDTAPSNPNNAFWFTAGTPDCFRCTLFIGDYQGMAMDSLGRAHMVWTDMRRTMASLGRKAHDIEYARR